MMQWFRFYNDAMRHPKIAQLSDAHFRLWVELLCVASENDGQIMGDEALKTVLRRRLDHLKGGLKALLEASLIECYEGGYRPYGWDKRQYKSDSSTERSRKFREKCNVARNVSATPPETETETDTDKTPNGVYASGDAAVEPALKPEHVFEAWNDMAARVGKPAVRAVTPSRRELVRHRIAQYGIDDFVSVFGKVERSEFLTGWRGCGFDWCMKRANFQKILEGNYD